jgi:hypothetical protein
MANKVYEQQDYTGMILINTWIVSPLDGSQHVRMAMNTVSLLTSTMLFNKYPNCYLSHTY